MGQIRLGQTQNYTLRFPMSNLNKYFVGIDVSKLTLDAALMTATPKGRSEPLTKKVANTAAGLKALDKWLRECGVVYKDTLLVIENTGIYHRRLWSYCAEAGIPIYIGNAAHIKWSLGLTRGKDDKTDSIRLCRYGCKEADDLKATPAPDPGILQLKDLITSRNRFIKQKSGNMKHLKELRNYNDRSTQAVMEKAYRDIIAGIEKSIKVLEAQIKLLINQNAAIKTNYKLLISVPGIGAVTAAYLIACTANFSAKSSGKQLACYAGLAPFETRSGTSIKGRPKVHKMGNKELKRLLYMGARASVQHNAEYRLYYERQRALGKHDLSAINAIKNKIIHRAAAVVNNQRPYVEKHKIAA